MKAKATLTAILVLLLAACTPFGGAKKAAVATPAAPKPAAPTPIIPPPPPPSLSVPQTQVELPKAQPLDPAALPDETVAETPPPAAAPAANRSAKRPGPPVATPPVEAPPPAPTVTEPRETFQELVPLAELKRLQERAASRRHEANQILNQLSRRQMNNAQRNVVATVRSFLTLSEQAEKQNDMRGADSLAERAQILAKELQSGK